MREFTNEERQLLVDLQLELRRFSTAPAGQSMDITTRQHKAGEQATALTHALAQLAPTSADPEVEAS